MGSQPEVIGAAVRQMASPAPASRLTSMSKSATANTVSLPTRNSRTTGVTKMCLASTVAPTRTGITSKRSSTGPPTSTKNRLSEFQTYKPAVTKSTSRFTTSKTKSKTGVLSCAGNTKNWSPVTQAPSRSARSSKRSMSASRTIDIESQRPSAYYIVVEEEREEKKTGTSCCCCMFWILAILALVALLILGLYHFAFNNEGQADRGENINDPPAHEVVTVPVPVYNNNYPGYQYEDNGVWKDYEPATSWLIEHHHQHGRKEFLLNLGHDDKMFSIDLGTLRQYNLAWDKTRQCHTMSNGRYVRDTVFRRIRRGTFTSEENSDLARVYRFTPKHNWKCLNNGQWQKYDRVISDYIEIIQFLGSKPGCYIDIGNDMLFWIDLRDRQQNSLEYTPGKGHKMSGGKYVPNGKSRQLEEIQDAPPRK